MARQGINRAVVAAGALALANPTLGETAAPSTAGIVSVRASDGGADTARLGFVAGGNGQVVAYVGSAVNEEDVAGAGFVVRVSDGTELAASGVAYDGATGLAMMRVAGPLPASYVFARAPVKMPRSVYGATINSPTGEIEIVDGTLGGIDPAPETGSTRPRWISHDASVGDRGIGSPLFNTCGQVTGVIVRDDSVAAPSGGTAAPAAWLEHVFSGQGLVLAWTDADCVTDMERSDVIAEVPGATEEEHAQTKARQKQPSTQFAGREETAQTARGVSKEAEERPREEEARALTQQQRAWQAASVIGALSGVLALLWIGRRLSQREVRRNGSAAEMITRGDLDTQPVPQMCEREKTQAPDVLLTGLDQKGVDISLSIPGHIIAGPSGSVVGRNPFEGAFVLNREGVSRKHFRFFVSNGQLMVEDLKSMNGTEIDGSVLTAGSRAVVRNGSQLGVGGLKLTVQVKSQAGTPGEHEQ